jgi:hypothetical protein
MYKIRIIAIGMISIVLFISSCSRVCSCVCQKNKVLRNIIAYNYTKLKGDTFTYTYAMRKENDVISDSLYNLFLKQKYSPDSFRVLSLKDSFPTGTTNYGISCAETSQYYKDSFYCTCADK